MTRRFAFPDLHSGKRERTERGVRAMLVDLVNVSGAVLRGDAIIALYDRQGGAPTGARNAVLDLIDLKYSIPFAEARARTLGWPINVSAWLMLAQAALLSAQAHEAERERWRRIGHALHELVCAQLDAVGGVANARPDEKETV